MPSDISAEGKQRSTEAFLAGAVLLGALAVRLAVWIGWRHAPFYSQPLLDAAFYRDLATGAFRPPPGPCLWNPLYPAFLELLFGLGGEGTTTPVFAQMAMGALGAELAYLTSRQWGLGRPGALVASALAALYAPFLVYEGLLLGAALAVFLVWIFLWTASAARNRRFPLAWAPAGAALGMAGLARPTLLAALPLVAAWIVLRKKPPGGRRFPPAAAFLAFALLPLVPTFVHNLSFSAPQPVALHGGINFYIGNRPGASGRYERPFPGPHGLWGQRRAAREEAQRRTGETMDWVEVDRFWYRKGLAGALANPGDWIALTGRKLLLLLNDTELPLNYNVAFLRERSPLLSLPLPTFGLVLALAAAGAVFRVTRKRDVLNRKGIDPPALLFLLGAGGATALFFIAARYRLPLLPPLLLLAGAGVSGTIGSLRKPQPVRLALAAAAALVAAVPALAPVSSPDFSSSFRLLGDALQKEGRPAEAKKAYEQSIEIRPSSAAWNNLGNVLWRFKGRREGEAAAEAFRNAIEMDEGNRQAWNNLGVVQKGMGDLLGAEATFQETVTRFPHYRKPAENLARLYEEQGHPEAARDFLRWWETRSQ